MDLTSAITFDAIPCMCTRVGLDEDDDIGISNHHNYGFLSVKLDLRSFETGVLV